MNEQLKIIISAEIDKLKTSVKAAKDEIDSFKKNTKVSSEQIDANLKKVGEATKSALKKVGGAVAAAGTALVALGASTKDYRENQAKLNAAFETAGASAGTATQVYNDLYRVLGEDDTAVEAANHLAKLTTNQKDLSEWTNICQGIYATFGDSLPIEGLTEAANETAKTGTVTGTLADALNWAGISEDAFNEKLAKCNTEAEREKLIRKTLNGVYDEAAANYEKTAAEVLRQNEEQAKLQATMASLGQVVTPIVTTFIAFANQALALVIPYIQQLAEQYAPQLEAALSVVAEVLGKIVGLIVNNIGVTATIAGIIATITAAIAAYNAMAAVKAAMDAAEVTTLGALVAAKWADVTATLAAMAPYALIVAAIAGFIAIVIKAYKENETFRNIVNKVFNSINSIIQNVMNIVKSIISTVLAAIKTIWDGGLKQILTLVMTILAKVVESFTTKLNAILTFVKTVFSGISTVIKSNLDTAKTIVSNVLKLIKSIFTGDFGAAKTAVGNIFNAIVNNIRTKLNTAKTVVKGAINAIKGFFNFKWSLPKLKLPHIGITGKFSLNPPSVPKFSINWNALGGVFDKPTLFGYGGSLQGIGENGAEAVVPLEKNTQWLDRIAERLAAKQNGIPIILQVDGKTFAQVSIDSINALTKQRGTLGLNLV